MVPNSTWKWLHTELIMQEKFFIDEHSTTEKFFFDIENLILMICMNQDRVTQITFSVSLPTPEEWSLSGPVPAVGVVPVRLFQSLWSFTD